jgi:hypothetical protein
LAYAVAADFRELTQKPWCRNLVLGEGDCSDAQLTSLIAQMAGQVEQDLDDDFDPPNPDNDETIYVDGTIGSRLFIPRRVRSLTTVSSRNLSNGNITAIPTSRYLLRSSLNAAGTAMVERRKRDWLDSNSGDTWFSSGGIQLIGKFGWAVVPDDIKRLVALRVYDMVKATGDPLSTVTQRVTADHSELVGESREITRITALYSRKMPAMA